jgi:hypothetical protein
MGSTQAQELLQLLLARRPSRPAGHTPRCVPATRSISWLAKPLWCAALMRVAGSLRCLRCRLQHAGPFISSGPNRGLIDAGVWTPMTCASFVCSVCDVVGAGVWACTSSHPFLSFPFPSAQDVMSSYVDSGIASFRTLTGVKSDPGSGGASSTAGKASRAIKASNWSILLPALRDVGVSIDPPTKGRIIHGDLPATLDVMDKFKKQLLLRFPPKNKYAVKNRATLVEQASSKLTTQSPGGVVVAGLKGPPRNGPNARGSSGQRTMSGGGKNGGDKPGDGGVVASSGGSGGGAATAAAAAGGAGGNSTGGDPVGAEGANGSNSDAHDAGGDAEDGNADGQGAAADDSGEPSLPHEQRPGAQQQQQQRHEGRKERGANQRSPVHSKQQQQQQQVESAPLLPVFAVPLSKLNYFAETPEAPLQATASIFEFLVVSLARSLSAHPAQVSQSRWVSGTTNSMSLVAQCWWMCACEWMLCLRACASARARACVWGGWVGGGGEGVSVCVRARACVGIGVVGMVGACSCACT